MSYATNSDLQGEFKSLSLTASTPLTTTKVDEWCLEESNFIDMYVGTKYTVPVDSGTSPKAFSLLKRLCIALVRPRMAAFLNIQAGGGSKASQSSEQAYTPKDAVQTLQDIRDAKIKLVDAVLATSQDGVESFTDDNSGTLQPPTFTRGDNDW